MVSDDCDPTEWSGSERDLAVPKKRRRRTTDQQDVDDEDGSMDHDGESASLSSRSSSLLQFECLEKHCEDIFRTSATSDPFQDISPFPPPSPSVMSSFSFDSLESNRWRFSASPDSLEDLPEEISGSDFEALSSDEGASSDDTLQHSSWSSRSRLRSFRSFDSLNLLQPQHSLAEMSQTFTSNSLLLNHPPQPELEKTTDLSTSVVTDVTRSPPATKNGAIPETASVMNNETSDGGGGNEPSVEAKPQRSAENLSEDSGFGDHCIPAGVTSPSVNARGGTVSTIIEDEDSCSSYYSDSSTGSGSGGVASSETSEQEKRGERKTPTTTTKKKTLKLKRESEFRERRGWGVEEAKFNSSCWQSAPSLLLGEEKWRKAGGLGTFPVPGPVCGTTQNSEHLSSVPDNLCLCLGEERANPSQQQSDATEVADENADKHVNTYNMATRFPVASTPNLMYSTQEEFLKNEQTYSSMIQVPLKSSSGDSNNELALSVEQAYKSLTPLPVRGAAASKGVHFSPVVSEVSWRDSYSDDDPQEDRDDEEVERGVNALEKGEDSTFPLLQKIQIGLPVGPGSTERERVVMELKQQDSGGSRPVTPTSNEDHVSATTSSNTPNAAAVQVVSMETKEQIAHGSSRECSSESSRRDSDLSTSSNTTSKKSSGSGGKFGGFFQRFSLRRLSGRVVGNNGSSKKQKEEKKKADVKSKRSCEKQPGAVTGAEYEDVTIIPLHPPLDEVERKPTPDVVVSSKPPLPPLPPRIVGNANKPVPSPRRRPAPLATNVVSGLQLHGKQDSTSMSRIDPPTVGLLETDLDTDISTVRPHQNGAAPSSKKALSLLNLGDIQQHLHNGATAMLLKPPPGGSTNRPLIPSDSRAKSMEFLLDKENQAAAQVGTLSLSFQLSRLRCYLQRSWCIEILKCSPRF